MAGNKAMITLQCGNYSNYIGAHFWNLQVLWQPLLLHLSQENIHSCTPLATGVSDSTCSYPQEAGFVYGGDGNKAGGQGQELLEVMACTVLYWRAGTGYFGGDGLYCSILEGRDRISWR